MRQEFINFVNELIKAQPELAEKLMTENIRVYFEALSANEAQKPELTDNGKLILGYLQKSDCKPYKAKEIAEGIFVSSRSVSGAIRKLVTDGFVEKIGNDPTIYTITEKGKNYKIEE